MPDYNDGLDEFVESSSPPSQPEPEGPCPQDSRIPKEANKSSIIAELCLIAFGKVPALSRSGMANKIKCLELLGRHKGLFIDKLEVSGPGGGPVQVEAGILGLLTIAELDKVEEVALIIEGAKKKHKALAEGK